MYEVNKLLERGTQLRMLNRKREAITELQNALLFDPYNFDILNELFLCHFELSEDIRAEEIVNLLISISPNNSSCYYYKSLVELRKKNYQIAEESILRAIEISPYIAEFFGALAAIFICKYEWQKGLDYANKGLELDPESSICLNYRTQCLLKLKRINEVDDSINHTLKSDPNDDYTHANIGWIQLEKGSYEQAKIHFTESLRINPNSSYAREGMMESIKSKNWFYRKFMNYKLFMSSRKKSVQLLIILIVFIGYQYLNELTNQVPLLLPFYYIIGFIFYFTWISNPVSNLLLRFDYYGKIMLNSKEKKGSEVVGLGTLIGFIAGVLVIITNFSMWWHLSLVSFSLVVPLYHAIEYEYFKNKKIIPLVFIAILFFTAIHSLYYLFIENIVSDTVYAFNYIMIAYAWFFNFGIIKSNV